MEKNKAPQQGQQETSITLRIICNKDLKIKVDSDAPQDRQPLLFSETTSERTLFPHQGTKKNVVYKWLCNSVKYIGFRFSKNDGSAATGLQKSEFLKALWGLREDGIVSCYYIRIQKEYEVLGFNRECDND